MYSQPAAQVQPQALLSAETLRIVREHAAALMQSAAPATFRRSSTVSADFIDAALRLASEPECEKRNSGENFAALSALYDEVHADRSVTASLKPLEPNLAQSSVVRSLHSTPHLTSPLLSSPLMSTLSGSEV